MNSTIWLVSSWGSLFLELCELNDCICCQHNEYRAEIAFDNWDLFWELWIPCVSDLSWLNSISTLRATDSMFHINLNESHLWRLREWGEDSHHHLAMWRVSTSWNVATEAARSRSCILSPLIGLKLWSHTMWEDCYDLISCDIHIVGTDCVEDWIVGAKSWGSTSSHIDKKLLCPISVGVSLLQPQSYRLLVWPATCSFALVRDCFLLVWKPLKIIFKVGIVGLRGLSLYFKVCMTIAETLTLL